MRYLQVAGLHTTRIKIDVDYIAGSDLDISTMNLNQTTGFEFDLPVSEFPILYNNNSFAVKITDNVKRSDSTIKVEDSSLFVAGRTYYIKNERIVISSITDATTVKVWRGRVNTFANNYYMQFGNYYITTEPQSFVGQRVFLYENDTLLTIGLISKNPQIQDNVAHFECDGLEKSLDQPLPILDSESWYRKSTGMWALVVFWMLEGSTIVISELPPIIDYINFDISYKMLDWSDQEIYFDRDRFSTLKEFVDLYSQLNLKVFAFNQSIGKFGFTPISAPLTLETIDGRVLKDFKQRKSPIKSELYNGIANITISHDVATYNFRSPQVNSFSDFAKLEIDLTKSNIKIEDLKQVGLKYIEQFSLIYSILTIPSSSFVYDYFEEGKYYNATDLDKIYTFQELSNLVFCIGKDDDDIKLLVVKDTIKSPISPSVPIQSISNVIHFGWSDKEWNIKDFLRTTQDKLDAILQPYDIPFFDVGFKYLLNERASGTMYHITGGSATSGSFLNTDAPIPDGNYWLHYDDYSVVIAAQQLWHFYDHKEY